MKSSIMYFWLPGLVFLFLLQPGCSPRTEAFSDHIKSFTSGSLHIKNSGDAPNRIYVDARQGSTRLPELAAQIGKALSHGKFTITDSPSKAGYILHLAVIGDGTAAPARIKEIVDSGYGSDAKMSGDGAKALVVDALLVQRRVPRAERPSRARLKNIADRNALGSNQMRIGIIQTGTTPHKPLLDAAFTETLARDLQNAMFHQENSASGVKAPG